MEQTTTYYRQLSKEVQMFFDTQYYDAFQLFEASRHPRTGLYADNYMTFDYNPDYRCSIAATGVGLISLCIADQEDWDSKAAAKALMTMQAVSGKISGCHVARDPQTGFFAHFVDMETGENLLSEFSTIDTSLLVTGALFAGRYFQDKEPEIAVLAQQLLNEIDWSIIVADIPTGSIHMVSENGEGKLPLPAFNEYVLVASLALLAKPDHQEIQALWEQNFSKDRIEALPRISYRDIPVLTDTNGGESFLSSFVHQFPFYLVSEYAKSEVYRDYFANACLADRLKWKELADVPSYVWGYGAGPNDGLHGGYHADQIDNSPGHIASAYIVAGFLPVFPAGIYDLYALYQLHLPYNHSKDSQLQSAYRYGLHRYSWWHLQEENRWYPPKVTLIDWSSMLYGLTAFKRGMSFFTDHLPDLKSN
ncbi:hypothetical protein [Gracilibacillus alcaliphilus]|uniref:hypothetical protein n=1 Tax=Gracilibacillus alcaliphilus TaxID=1401441 RepID=UPI00195DDD60|nr:hypothetical protein [Gracilibacillus alcaliphilus]MBM7675249.1 hypothetical protein [Gracilibacillus alcaliphilus]